jgi:hypothetical protein
MSACVLLDSFQQYPEMAESYGWPLQLIPLFGMVMFYCDCFWGVGVGKILNSRCVCNQL